MGTWSAGHALYRCKLEQILTGAQLFSYATAELASQVTLERCLRLASVSRERSCHVTVLRRGQPCRREVFLSASGCIVTDAVLELVTVWGCSVHVSSIDSIDEIPLNELSDVVERDLAPRRIDAFFSPSDGRALNAHFDGHDSLILQLSDAKEWMLWPAYTDYNGPDKVPRQFERLTREYIEKTPPSAAFSLLKGGALLLRRGVVHSVKGSQLGSAHISLWL